MDWQLKMEVSDLTDVWPQNWVVDSRQFVVAPVFVERRLVDSDVYDLLHSTPKVFWFPIQNSKFVQIKMVSRGFELF